MDGYELCTRIKEDERTRRLPVLLLTALREPEDIIRGLMSGADNFLTKPYDDRQLLSRLSYVLVNQEIRRNTSAEIGLEIFFAGKRQHIGAERIQILDLLLSTYEEALEQKRELERVNTELRNALTTIKTLKGIIPICANCKKIRDDQGYWNRLEEYISRHSDADFSHGICPDCAHDLYPEHFPER
jgi:two-component system cell cycle response regulator